MNYGHLIVVTMAVLNFAAAWFYFQQGDRPRAVVFTSYGVASIATIWTN